MSKNFKNLLAALLFASAFTSCDHKDLIQVVADDGQSASLTITIKSDDFTPAITRATTSDPGVAEENRIDVYYTLVGIFKSDGTAIAIETPDVLSSTSLTMERTNPAVDWLAEADSVYVAYIQNTTKMNALKAATNKKEFWAAANLDIETAITFNTMNGSVIPKFGKAKIAHGDNHQYTATVNIEHLLSKVTLNSLGVDFSASSTPGASFQPEQVFLINVPDNVNMDKGENNVVQNKPAKYYQGDLNAAIDYTSKYAGSSVYTDPANMMAKYTYRTYNPAGTNTYLGTINLTDQTVMSASNNLWVYDDNGTTKVRQYYLYTMPNTTAASDAFKTRLVIRGTFKANSSAEGEQVYYAVPLSNNEGGTLNTNTLDPNKNYVVDVVIKGKGVEDAYATPTGDISGILSANLNISTFSSNESHVIVGQGEPVAEADLAQVPKAGDIYYSDGTWSSILDDSKTPIGIVFSTAVAAEDRAAGYTHGYVLALKDAADSGSEWGPYLDEAPNFCIGYIQTMAQYIADMNGRTNTTILVNDGHAHDAATAAVNYKNTVAAPAGSSGWFLPSIGQWIALCNAFGAEIIQTSSWSVSTVQAIASIPAINAAITSAGGVALNDNYYWSSSENDYYDANYIQFDEGDCLEFNCEGKRNNNRVRAALAF